MPKKLERKLRKEARDKFPGDKERQDAYVAGPMRKLGYWGGNKKKKRDRDEHDYED